MRQKTLGRGRVASLAIALLVALTAAVLQAGPAEAHGTSCKWKANGQFHWSCERDADLVWRWHVYEFQDLWCLDSAGNWHCNHGTRLVHVTSTPWTC